MTRSALETVTALASPQARSARPPRAAADYFTSLQSAAQFVSGKHSLICPTCRYNMYEVKTHDLVIDFCLNCQSLWFDEGELQRAMSLTRERGGLDLVPDTLKGNQTAELICYMLGTLDD